MQDYLPFILFAFVGETIQTFAATRDQLLQGAALRIYVSLDECDQIEGPTDIPEMQKLTLSF
jgi:hypothetical protein